ncbi:hypothetical protein E2C01_084301 [Portunus trituberculatus]|uniref:Uncharacterized protein n=1 Tax=Portunus trituberculatus TaxID=210409 RepID=A0A5B7J3X1_PORTR|nr:hypothetical protein [Portunus trituberculatus]
MRRKKEDDLAVLTQGDCVLYSDSNDALLTVAGETRAAVVKGPALLGSPCYPPCLGRLGAGVLACFGILP